MSFDNNEYRYIIRPNMLDEIPYRIYGADNIVHYSGNLGDNIIEDARHAKDYYIVHGGPNCKRAIEVERKKNGTYEGIASCRLSKFKRGKY